MKNNSDIQYVFDNGEKAERRTNPHGPLTGLIAQSAKIHHTARVHYDAIVEPGVTLEANVEVDRGYIATQNGIKRISELSGLETPNIMVAPCDRDEFLKPSLLDALSGEAKTFSDIYLHTDAANAAMFEAINDSIAQNNRVERLRSTFVAIAACAVTAAASIAGTVYVMNEQDKQPTPATAQKLTP